MALSGWSSKCSMTVDHTLVPATETDIPILLIGSNFPSEIFGTTGGCLDDGSDIRFTTDSAGDNEIPRDIINIDKTTSTLSIYVKLPNISSTVDTVFYLFWNNPSANEPGKGSASEFKLVWSDYYGVFHLNNVVTGWKGVEDSAGNWSNMTVNGTVTEIDGHASGLIGHTLDTDFGMDLHEYLDLAGNTLQLSFWYRFNGSTSDGTISTGSNSVPLEWVSGGFGPGWGGGKSFGSATVVDQWNHMVMSINAGVSTFYVNGVNQTVGTSTAGATQFNKFGMRAATLSVDISEIRRTRDVLRGQTYYQVIYANESNPAPFISSGTVETSSASYELRITGLNDNSEVRIYRSSDGVELTGVENSVGDFTWAFDFAGTYDVDIVIHHISYEYIRISDFTMSATNITIPVSQRFDRTYYNP